MSTQNQFKSRYTKLLERRTDRLSKSIHLDERLRSATASETVKYILGSMLPVDSEYTKNSFREADRVQNQLEKKIPSGFELQFDHQGSVTNDTHIKLYSDIDLLGLSSIFIVLKHPLQPIVRWEGNPVSHLALTRSYAIQILKSAFPEANVDTSKGKAIGVSRGSLSRHIDVVISNWFDTQEYRQTGSKIWRGIEVFDADSENTIVNYPFLHNYKIDEKDRITNGNTRRLIRFTKSIKADAESEIKLTSYDLVGLVWNMPNEALQLPFGDELKLVEHLYAWGKLLLLDESLRKSLQVPNGTRRLFHEENVQLPQLQKLLREIEPLLSELQAIQFYGLRKVDPRLREVFLEHLGHRLGV